MAAPYKNLSDTAGKSPKASTELIPLTPGHDDPRINQERSDVVPDHPPIKPWPTPSPIDSGTKPMKSLKG